MSDGPKIPLSHADRVATVIAAALQPYCERIEIAGSIRRRRQLVGDIDLVCVPGKGGRTAILQRSLQSGGTLIKGGDQYAVIGLPGPQTVMLDLWFAHNGTAGGDLLTPNDPPNFGVLLLCRTGSVEHNIWIAQTAKAAGLHFNPHRGIERKPGGEVIASAEEREVFAALGMSWIEPERRER